MGCMRPQVQILSARQMKKLFNFISNNRPFVVVSTCFFILYCLLSLVNHYNFRTAGWDLGIFNQALYQYAHLQFAPNTVDSFPNMLADHFEITMMFVAPFYYIFDSYTLLIFQILMTIFGAVGIYLYLNRKTNDQWLSLGGVLIFYCFYGLFAAIFYDYHNNLTGIMFLPWILLALNENSKKKYYFFLALMILSKETFCLIAFFLGIYITLFENIEWKKHGIITMLIGFLSLELILSVIIPYFNNYQPYQHWVYGEIGKNPASAIQHIILHPLSSIAILFNNPIKLNSWGMLSVTGGMAAILDPLAALLFIPLLASKYLSSVEYHWTYLYQYSVEFAPILGISVPLVLKKTPGRLKYYILILFIVLNLVVSFSVPFNDFKRISNIFNKYFYYNPTTQDSRAITKKIPPGVSVSAENSFVPHLADREKIYQFPVINDADYILVNSGFTQIYPLETREQYLQEMEKIKKENKYKLFYKINNMEIYKK